MLIVSFDVCLVLHIFSYYGPVSGDGLCCGCDIVLATAHKKFNQISEPFVFATQWQTYEIDGLS